MKGAIFKGIQDLIMATIGAEAWQEIARIAGCNEPFFVTGEDYPDATAIALVRAAAEVSGMTVDAVMIEFGKHWVLQTAPRSYPMMFGLAGDSARSFLLNMNRVHDLVVRNLPGTRPPILKYETTDESTLLIHYQSSRGLCKILEGLIRGVGLHFKTELTVAETACMKTGSPACIMRVVFP